ncbi:sodium:solute symporter family protein [Flintibacter porci]
MGSGIAAQYVALGTCFNVLLGIDARIGMAIGAVIIIIITYSSGMWGVAITDYIQFVFLGLGVLVATAVCFASAGGWQGIVSAAPESYFEIDPVSSIKLLCSTSLAVLIDGNRYSRFFSAKDAKTASRAALITAVPQFLVGFFAMVMGLAAIVVLPAGTPKDMVFPSLLAITIPTGLKGLCIGALIAAILSTADSYILTTSTNVSIDIYKNLINPNATDTQTLKVTRFSVLGAGIVGLVFALLLPDVIGLWTLSSTAYIGGCLIPMMYGLFSKKKSHILRR